MDSTLPHLWRLRGTLIGRLMDSRTLFSRTASFAIELSLVAKLSQRRITALDFFLDRFRATVSYADKLAAGFQPGPDVHTLLKPRASLAPLRETPGRMMPGVYGKCHMRTAET